MEPRPTNTHRTNWPLLIAAALLLVTAGCIPAPGADNAFYILLPYATSIVATGFAFAAQAHASLRRPKPGAPEPDWNAQLRSRSLAAAVATAVTAAGELIYLLLNGAHTPFGYGSEAAPRPNGPLFATAYLALLLAAATCLLLVRKRLHDEHPIR